MAEPTKETVSQRIQTRDARSQISDAVETHAAAQVNSSRPQSDRDIDHGFELADAAHLDLIMSLAEPPARKISRVDALAADLATIADFAGDVEPARKTRRKDRRERGQTISERRARQSTMASRDEEYTFPEPQSMGQKIKARRVAADARKAALNGSDENNLGQSETVRGKKGLVDIAPFGTNGHEITNGATNLRRATVHKIPIARRR